MERWQAPPLRHKQRLFFWCGAAALFACILLGAPRLAHPSMPEDLDPASSGLMTGDLLYNQLYGLDGPLARKLEPRQALSDGSIIHNAAAIRELFVQQTPVARQDFAPYDSNLCVQRYAYWLCSAALPLSNGQLLALFGAVNTLLFALALMLALVWLAGITGYTAAGLVLLAVALFSPSLTLYAPNLYWAGFSLLLPMAGSTFAVLRRPRFASLRSFRWFAFGTALVSCLIKQMLYFEYLSCALVAMMVPHITDFLLARDGAGTRQTAQGTKRGLATLLYPAAGGLASFALASGTKLLVLGGWYGSLRQALQSTLGNVLKNTHSASAAGLAARGTDASLAGVLSQMFGQPAVQLGSHALLSFAGLTAVLGLLTVLVVSAKHLWGNNRRKALFWQAQRGCRCFLRFHGSCWRQGIRRRTLCRARCAGTCPTR